MTVERFPRYRATEERGCGGARALQSEKRKVRNLPGVNSIEQFQAMIGVR